MEELQCGGRQLNVTRHLEHCVLCTRNIRVQQVEVPVVILYLTSKTVFFEFTHQLREISIYFGHEHFSFKIKLLISRDCVCVSLIGTYHTCSSFSSECPILVNTIFYYTIIYKLLYYAIIYFKLFPYYHTIIYYYIIQYVHYSESQYSYKHNTASVSIQLIYMLFGIIIMYIYLHYKHRNNIEHITFKTII